jgi:pilus assembly protein FimV
LIAKSHRWQKTALAAAAITLLGLSGTGALALSLGRITVQSALGEPLRAEIDVPDINAEEAASLKTSVAAPEAFTAAGLEYNPAMSSLQASLQRRPDGRAFIRLSTDRAINDPFVDMILEASWSSGRIVRDYTMLFDPPALRRAAVTPTLPQIGAATPTTSRAPAAQAPVPASEPNRSAAIVKPSRPAAVVKAPAESTRQVVVKNGDTASKIAANTKPAGVSLDQMLVALLRANPDAFVNSNINRIRSGSVMSVPSVEQAQSISAAEASQTIVAQSKDFNEFRRSLASNAPVAAVGAADRKSGGSIDAKVEDKKPAAVTPDKLTLSKGALQSKADDEKIAKERADKDAAARAAEIAKNVADLKKIGAATALTPAPTLAASEPKALPTPAPVVATAPIAPAASAPPAPMASAPVAAASAPAKPKAVPVVPAVEPPGIVDDLLENPLLPAGAGSLLALLGGFAFWRMRQRQKNVSHADSSFLESRLQPDSFFGASGGQRVDTNNDGGATGSSMVYSASQLDAADDVDPVAEADVYLAYGRDLQAEEILKEAMITNPGRLAIHTKLLEIFAKRRDTKGFEASAAQAYKLTGSNSPEWTRICEMGLGIDPSNPMYQPGGTPAPVDAEAPAAAGAVAVAVASAFGSSTISQSVRADLNEPTPASDLDLDLDFSLDDEPASAISDVTGGTASASTNIETVKMEAPIQEASIPLDFDISAPAELSESTDLPEISLAMNGIDFTSGDDLHRPDFESTDTMAVEPVATAPLAKSDPGMLEFDLDSLSLDLDTPGDEPTQAPESVSADPLETKLALAEEFISIGDEDGARALIEEVVSESSGDMRVKAQRALANLS